MLYNIILLMIAGILLCYLINRIFTRLEYKHTMKLCKEFAEVFPGRCMICSFHRYGLQNGLTRKPEPEPHNCIEKKKEN